jgi:serine/threonine protein kinase
MFRLYAFLHSMKGRMESFSEDYSEICTTLDNLKGVMPYITQRKSASGDSSGRRKRSGRTFPAFKIESLALIAAKGYQLSPEYSQSFPENVAKAEKDGCVVALKLVGTMERSILESVQTNGTYANHVVELIDVIPSASYDYDIIVMPWLSPLDTTDLADTDRNFMMNQFLDGVWFLHKYGIAHLDLKPGNVLVKHTNDSLAPHISIIDFGMSLRVDDEETLVTGFRGTPSWTAPEVGREGGPKMTYSAIRADRWSCGRMLQYFCPNTTLFTDVCKELLDPDPRRRPSLDNALEILQRSSCGTKRNVKRNVGEDMRSVMQKRPRTLLKIQAL